MSAVRVGQGFDVHPLVAGRKLILAGIEIPHSKGLEGHSDGDALAHAVIDALLGATGLGDIGQIFPSSDAAWKGADSMAMLSQVMTRVRQAGWKLANLDATVIAQEPRLSPHREAMERRLADALGVELGAVNVKSKTTDHLGFTGRGEGLAALAVVLIEKI